jgi:hypothetical protein
MDNFLETLYHLGQHPEEVTRLVALEPETRIMHLAILGHTLKAPAAAAPAPAPLKPAVSKAPAPGRNLSGIDPGAERTTSDAKDFEDFKKIRHRK